MSDNHNSRATNSTHHRSGSEKTEMFTLAARVLPMVRNILVLSFFALALGCDHQRSASKVTLKPAEAPAITEKSVAVVPDGFDQRLVDILRCPENLSVVRLATAKELDATNERIRTGKLRNWGGKSVTMLVNAMLVRADGKIAYRFERAAPVMIIEEALVIDETVGKPDPDKHRK